MSTPKDKATNKLIEQKEELMSMLVQIKKRSRRERAAIRYTIYSLAIVELENLYEFMATKNEESITSLKTSLTTSEMLINENLDQLDELISKKIELRRYSALASSKQILTSEDREIINEYKKQNQKVETKVKGISKKLAKYNLERIIYYDKINAEKAKEEEVVIPFIFKKIKEENEYVQDINLSEMFVEDTDTYKKHHKIKKRFEEEEKIEGINIPKSLVKQRNMMMRETV